MLSTPEDMFKPEFDQQPVTKGFILSEISKGRALGKTCTADFLCALRL